MIEELEKLRVSDPTIAAYFSTWGHLEYVEMLERIIIALVNQKQRIIQAIAEQPPLEQRMEPPVTHLRRK